MEKEENVAPKMLEKTEVDFEPVDEHVEAFYDNENGISEQSRFHHSFENTHFKVKHGFKILNAVLIIIALKDT